MGSCTERKVGKKPHTECWGHPHVEEDSPTSEEETQESARCFWPKGKVTCPVPLVTRPGPSSTTPPVPHLPYPVQLLVLCPESLSGLSFSRPRCHCRPSCCISYLHLCGNLWTGFPSSPPDIPFFLSQSQGFGQNTN